MLNQLRNIHNIKPEYDFSIDSTDYLKYFRSSKDMNDFKTFRDFKSFKKSISLKDYIYRYELKEFIKLKKLENKYDIFKISQILVEVILTLIFNIGVLSIFMFIMVDFF